MSGVILFGGGGHAKVLIDAIHSHAEPLRCVIVDVDSATWDGEVLGIPVVGGDDRIGELLQEDFTRFVIAMGGIRQIHLRKQLFDAAESAGLEAWTVAHDRATVSRFATVEAGAQLMAGCVVNPSAYIGLNTIINTNAVVEHDCVIGSHVHIAPSACLAGAVRVGDMAHIGAGAVVRENITIGPRAVIGAGAVVVRDVPPDTVVVGVPAQKIRRSTECPTD
ncbi:MAG: acetyltransferase [Planctomycetaceae bacterium]|nr:acetyltransferase [Planctomycetaceae bacterium]